MKEVRFDPTDFEPARQIALGFPNAADSLSHYGTPSVKIKDKLLCRLHENGEWIAVRTDFADRDGFLERYPESCFITPHYRDYPYICIDVKNVGIEVLREVLESGHRAIVEGKSAKKRE